MAKRTAGNSPKALNRSEPLKLYRELQFQASLNSDWFLPSPTVKGRRKKREPVPVDFKHNRTESHHEDSGSITFYETRGVRYSSVNFLFSDFEETLPYRAGHSEAGTYASFLETANSWLKEAGEKKFSEVVDDAVAAKQKARTRKEKNRIERFTFQRWWFEIGMKHGFLSPAAIAADFLTASDFVHRLTKGNQQLQRAIYHFAGAWHWMQFEAKGEHELAAIGLKSIRVRAKGPEARQEKSDIKKAIVKDSYEHFAADEKNGRDRWIVKGAAGKLHDGVNQKLRELGIPEMALKSLINEIGPLVKERFPK